MEFRNRYHAIIAWVLVSVCGVFAGEFDFTVEVPAGQIQCFFQEVKEPRYVTMEIDYQVRFVIVGCFGRVLFLLLSLWKHHLRDK